MGVINIASLEEGMFIQNQIQGESRVDVLDVSDRISELSRAVTGLGSLLYGMDPIPASGGELASLLLILQREVDAIGVVIADLHSALVENAA